MGSIISFPILCIINAAVCKLAVDLTDGPKRNNLSAYPLLINGDDCAFVASEECKSAWEKIALMAGLEPSVGKTYFSKDFVNINSTNFLVATATQDSGLDYDMEFRQVPYVNLGLLYGLKRSGGKADLNDVDVDLGSRHVELLRLAAGCVSEDDLTRKFVNHNWSSLKTFRDNRIPWFVPKQYGGLGMQETANPDWRMSRMDRRICTAMVLGELPRPPSPVVVKDVALLHLHSLTSEVLYASGVDVHSGHWSLNLEQEDPLKMDPLYLWFLMMTPEHVITMRPEDAVWVSIQQNRRVWTYYESKLDMHGRAFDEIRPRKFLHNVELVCA